MSKYVDAVVWIACQQALWSHWDEDIGFDASDDVFEWLNAVHAEWTSIPTRRLYSLACKRYISILSSKRVGQRLKHFYDRSRLPDLQKDISACKCNNLVCWLL
jgi:hypothetical protein